MLSKQFIEVEVSSIKVLPDRQRQDLGDINSLAESIERIGVINPLVITREMTLVAGERRLRACQQLKLTHVPIQFVDQLSTKELACIELEENVKRKDLTWQEEVVAVSKLHELNVELYPGWTLADTGKAVGCEAPFVSRAVSLSKELSDPRIAEATTKTAAYNILRRRAERASANEFNSIIEGTMMQLDKELPVREDGKEPASKTEEPLEVELPEEEAAPPAQVSILNQDAIEWMDNYSGPYFNFLHCDFPYGIRFNNGTQVAKTWAAYNDDPDVYWALLSALARNHQKLLAPSSHVMFWFSMKFYKETLAFFETHMPRIELNHFPLIWVKSDNKGLLPDPLRGPRRIYETAFMGSCGDRHVISSVSNAYLAPSGKADAVHVSEKPLPVLKHFFKMFVDDSTTLLDPTCGSGTALRAAEFLGAKRVLGLELDRDHFTNAEQELRKFRVMQKLTM